MRKSLSLLLCLLLAACPAAETPPEAPPVPVVEVSPAVPQLVAPGEPSVVEYRIRNPDGSVPANYRFHWVPPDAAEWISSHETPAPGTERITLTSKGPLGAFTFVASFQLCAPWNDNPCYRQTDLDAPLAWRIVAGGPAAEAVLPFARIELGVGEKRPVWAIASTGGEQARYSHEPLEFVCDSSVATVDAVSGELTGREPGEGTVVIRRNGRTLASLQVTVTEQPLGPPQQASLVALEGSQNFRFPREGLAATLALDSRGWPLFVAQHLPDLRRGANHDQSAVVLARWTGSGWGFETVSAPAEVASEARLAVDADDHLWIAYASSQYRSVVIADRALSDPPGQFRRRVLDASIPSLAGSTSPYFDGYAYPGVGRIVAAPREGGGAWVGFTTRVIHVGHPEGECAWGTMLAEATDAAVTVTESETVVDRASGAGFCPDDWETLTDSPPLYLVPQGAGAPQVQRGEVGVPQPSAEWLALEHAGVPFPGVQSVPEAGLFSFEYGLKQWYGDKDPFKIGSYSPLGQDRLEPATTLADLKLLEENYLDVRRGAAWSEGRFHQLVGYEFDGSATLAYTTTSLVKLAPLFAGEEAGAWLTFEDYPAYPTAVTPPAVLADGTRLLFTATERLQTAPVDIVAQGHLWRSAGPGQPFAPLFDTNATTLWTDGPFYEADGALWTFAPDGQLKRSPDRGASWFSFGSIASPPPLFSSAVFFPDGRALALYLADSPAGASTLFYSADVGLARPFVSRLALPDLVVLPGERHEAALLRDGERAWLLTPKPRTTPPMLEVRGIDAAGELDGMVEVEVPPGTHPGLGARAADGALVLLAMEPSPEAELKAFTAVRIDPSTNAAQVVQPFGTQAQYRGCVPPVLLADGRIAAACTRVDVEQGFERVVYTLSADGLSWSTPVVLRPEGGVLQRVMGMAAEPDGGLLLVVGDDATCGHRTFAPLVTRIATP